MSWLFNVLKRSSNSTNEEMKKCKVVIIYTVKSEAPAQKLQKRKPVIKPESIENN